jgi:hypothetical protein
MVDDYAAEDGLDGWREEDTAVLDGEEKGTTTIDDILDAAWRGRTGTARGSYSPEEEGTTTVESWLGQADNSAKSPSGIYSNYSGYATHGHAENSAGDYARADGSVEGSQQANYPTGDSYFTGMSYREQQTDQTWNFWRNAPSKRIMVSDFAEELGAWGATSITDSLVWLNPRLQYEPVSFRREVRLHEDVHDPHESMMKYIVPEMLKFEPWQKNYKVTFKPGV